MVDPLQLTPTQQEMLRHIEMQATTPQPPTPPPPVPSPRHNVEEMRRPLVRPVLPEPAPGPLRTEHVNTALLETAQAISRILATRLLLLIAVLTASAVWGVVVWEPSQLGIIAGGVYSVVSMWPLVFLYLRKG